MKTRLLILVSFILIFCTTFPAYAQKKKPTAKAASAAKPTGKCSGNSLTTDEINQLLAIHNFDRAAHNLASLKWDCKLAQTAQDWANRSTFVHRDDTNYGENIVVSASSDELMGSMMDRWLAEKSFWTNKTGTCEQGKTCTHYTQIMWKTTARVGCGVNRNATGKWKLMFVCNYDPAGNTGGPAF